MNKYRIELTFQNRLPIIEEVWAKHMDEAIAKVKEAHNVTDSTASIGRRVSP